MEHTEPEPEPSARWLPLLLIVGALLAAGLLCSDALDRLAPVPGQAEPGIQPGIALVVATDRAPSMTATEPLPFEEPVLQPEPPEATPPTVETVSTESGSPSSPDGSAPVQPNGNTNPNANPNGHTNHAATGAGQNAHGQGGRP